MILVTGGAGFIGSQLRPATGSRRRGRAGRQPRQADLRRQPRTSLDAVDGDPRYRFVQRRHRRPRRGRPRCFAEHRPRRGRALRRREPRRPLDRRPGRRSSRPTSSARSACSRRRAPTGTALAGAGAAGVPLPARLDRRGLRLARARRAAFTETTPYDPELALLGVEGRRRPSRARLPPHLRPAGADRPTARTTTARTSSRRS